MKLIWAPEALQDVEEGVAYIAQDSIAAAIAVEDRIIAAAEGLVQLPHMGRARTGGRRELVVASTSFKLIYRLEVRAVIVVRVWHMSRRPFA
ncbi:type II toxin-antitoxin system RelE/ParE family toxin [Brevundimonas intermedia]|uniref:type II toxin-antitoxin system RelE/ParE family toxin n=1 Tax=Brevundimonas intermedia TaxID=74315 RepID=UPI00320BA044